jgi:hypothetical protein
MYIPLVLLEQFAYDVIAPLDFMRLYVRMDQRTHGNPEIVKH